MMKRCYQCRFPLDDEHIGIKTCIKCKEKMERVKRVRNYFGLLYGGSSRDPYAVSDVRKRFESKLLKKCWVCGIMNVEKWMVADPEGYLGCRECVKFEGEDITEEWNADITENDLP